MEWDGKRNETVVAEAGEVRMGVGSVAHAGDGIDWVGKDVIHGAGWEVILVPGGGNRWLFWEVGVEGVGRVVPLVGLRPCAKRVRLLFPESPPRTKWVCGCNRDQVGMWVFFLYGVDLTLCSLGWGRWAVCGVYLGAHPSFSSWLI